LASDVRADRLPRAVHDLDVSGHTCFGLEPASAAAQLQLHGPPPAVYGLLGLAGHGPGTPLGVHQVLIVQGRVIGIDPVPDTVSQKLVRGDVQGATHQVEQRKAQEPVGPEQLFPARVDPGDASAFKTIELEHVAAQQVLEHRRQLLHRTQVHGGSRVGHACEPAVGRDLEQPLSLVEAVVFAPGVAAHDASERGLDVGEAHLDDSVFVCHANSPPFLDPPS